jgi:hypothetical protein
MRSRWYFFASLICSLSLRAEIKEPQSEFKGYLVAPVRIHLLVTKGELNLTTTLEEKDITRIFGKVNRIWGHAGIHLPVERLVKEPAENPNAYRQNHQSRNLRWLLALRPKASRAESWFHIYYLKRFGVNGVYIGRDGMFVKDIAHLRGVEGGVDEPIPRVTAHELGHAFTLKHRQSVTNLMASGTSGWTLNEAEIKQVRIAAGKMKWIRPAKEILKEADMLHQQGRKNEAAILYRQIAGIPLHCPETTRARKRARR